VRSWLLELAERRSSKDPGSRTSSGYVEDSGEGAGPCRRRSSSGCRPKCWRRSLFARFRSRQDDSFRDRVLAALRQSSAATR
jgi:6-phosphogluconate dehydrogenase